MEGQAHRKHSDISVHSWWYYGFWNSAEPCSHKKAQEELGWPVVFTCLSYSSFPMTKHHDQRNVTFTSGARSFDGESMAIVEERGQQASRQEAVAVAESLYLSRKLKVERVSQDF